jgi:aminopeptidase-like protein
LAHLHTRPDQPAAIPFEFSYYQPKWGFCVQHERLDEFSADRFEVLIESHFETGQLEMGVLRLPGEEEREIVLMAHLCHPCMANDDLAGVVVLLGVASELMRRPRRRFSYRFLVGPETIGPIAYLSRHEDLIPRMELGLFLEMLGNDDRLSLQHSLRGDSPMDLALLLALQASDRPFRRGRFREVIANDERILNGPGVNVPTCSLSRSAYWGRGETPYPQYHTSADSPEIIHPRRLLEARDLVLAALDILEGNYTPRRLFKGPVFLSRYGLWVDWRVDRQLNAKQEEVMRLLEGDLDLLTIAHRLELDFHTLKDWLDKFAAHGLIFVGPSPGRFQVGP